jgi:hypothetical protein
MAFLALKKMQAKTTLKFHLIPFRRVIIKKITNGSGDLRAGEGTLIQC